MSQANTKAARVAPLVTSALLAATAHPPRWHRRSVKLARTQMRLETQTSLTARYAQLAVHAQPVPRRLHRAPLAPTPRIKALLNAAYAKRARSREPQGRQDAESALQVVSVRRARWLRHSVKLVPTQRASATRLSLTAPRVPLALLAPPAPRLRFLAQQATLRLQSVPRLATRAALVLFKAAPGRLRATRAQLEATVLLARWHRHSATQAPTQATSGMLPLPTASRALPVRTVGPARRLLSCAPQGPSATPTARPPASRVLQARSRIRKDQRSVPRARWAAIAWQAHR